MHYIIKHSNLHSSSEWHQGSQRGSPYLVKALVSRDFRVASGVKHTHSQEQDCDGANPPKKCLAGWAELWKAARKRTCYCWMTPLTEPSLRLATRWVKYFLHLKVLLFSQSLFQCLVVWGETRHFSELPFVWKTEGRKTGKHNTGWRNLETRQQHFYSPHYHNPGLMWLLDKMLNYATISTNVLLHSFWALQCS